MFLPGKPTDPILLLHRIIRLPMKYSQRKKGTLSGCPASHDGGVMSKFANSRREFLKAAALTAGGALLLPGESFGNSPLPVRQESTGVAATEPGSADYTLRIVTSPVELAPKRIVSMTTYNGQFPGPLLRFKEGQAVTVDIYNDTDTPEQLHWHGQKVPTDVDGAAEEGTPYIPAHGRRRIVFTPQPVGRALLSHSQPGGREPFRRPVQRPSRPGLHRTADTIPEDTTARYFSSSRSSSPRSAAAATWQWISCRQRRE